MIHWLSFAAAVAFISFFAAVCLRDIDRRNRRTNTLDLVNEYVMHTDDGWRDTLEDIHDLPEVA